MKTITAKLFDLRKTVECGQVFRYELLNGWYYITIGNFILKIRQSDDELEYAASKKISSSFVKRYFGLDLNLKKILKSINRDENIEKAIKSAFGLRIIRQPPFECLVSYICSAASNIPRIKRNLNQLSSTFGRRISLRDYLSYSFPQPEDFRECASLEKSLRKCGLGFRARFFPQIIMKISESSQEMKSWDMNIAFDEFFKRVKRMGYRDAKRELMKFCGVGSKVADCILLFSLDFTEAFPVDVWIRRVMSELYFKNNQVVSNREIEDFGREYFGRYAGYAQEYLFYWRRTTG